MAFNDVLNGLKKQNMDGAKAALDGIAAMTISAVSPLPTAIAAVKASNTKLNNKQALDSATAKKAKMYEFIGMEIFDLYAAGKIDLETIAPFCKEIEKLNEEIAKIEAEIYVAPKVCDCGQKLPKGPAKFCPACGKSIVAAPAPEQAKVNYVECVCGEQSEAGSTMCPACGRRLSDSN